MKGKTILTYGTFDMFHIGHLRLIERLKSMGDTLIVGVSTDEFNESKGKKCIIPYEQRAEIVSAIKGVSRVIPEQSWDQKIIDIKKFNVDIFAMGSDWENKFDFLKEYCEVCYLERTDGISTTTLKSQLSVFKSISREDLIKAFDTLETLRKDLE
jgi:glycerol-3-phosphate cytidylyltransferase